MKLQMYAIAGAAVLATVIGAFLYGVNTGKVRERDKWLAAEIERQEETLETIYRLRDQKEQLEREIAAAAEQTEAEKAENRRLTDEIRALNARTPTVQERRIEVPGDCPVVTCPVIDLGLDYRLHNCAIDPGACDLRDTDAPDVSDDEVPIIGNPSAFH